MLVSRPLPQKTSCKFENSGECLLSERTANYIKTVVNGVFQPACHVLSMDYFTYLQYM